MKYISFADFVMTDGYSYVKLSMTKISVSEFEEKISKFVYSGENLPKDKSVEKAKLPPFEAAFAKCLIEFRNVPTEDQFLQCYIEDNFIEKNSSLALKKNQTETYNKEGIKNKALRYYPSLIRKYHFYLMCSECGKFDDVSYQLSSDVKHGLGIRVKKNNQSYMIRLGLKSTLSYYHSESKTNEENVITLDIDINNCRRVGSFRLYAQKDVDYILSKFGNEKLSNI